MEAPPVIKLDPDTVLAGPDSDNEDAYEDTGELQLPKEAIDAQILRVPEILYAAWSDIDEDEEVELGTIKHYTNTDKWQLQLNSTAKANEKAPKEYSLTLQDPKSHNTFVFSEKDLPDYTRKRKPDIKDEGPGGGGGNRHGGKRQKRTQQWYTRTIPKQTALAGAVKSEFLCVADDTATFRKLMKDRIQEEERNKPRIKIIDEEIGRFMDRQAKQMLAWEAGMQPGVTHKIAAQKKSQANRAARIPQNELMDLIFTHFQDYRYWSLRALKQHINQPEMYIRQTLELIAFMVKGGRNNNDYKLKPEYEEKHIDLSAIKGETAPVEAGADGESSAVDEEDGDEEDEEMEDVA